MANLVISINSSILFSRDKAVHFFSFSSAYSWDNGQIDTSDHLNPIQVYGMKNIL